MAMNIYPLKKLIIIYGFHIDNIQIHTAEEYLLKILTKKYFIVNNDLTDLAIVVYKSSLYSDHSKTTHIVINLGNEITEIKYYTTKHPKTSSKNSFLYGADDFGEMREGVVDDD